MSVRTEHPTPAPTSATASRASVYSVRPGCPAPPDPIILGPPPTHTTPLARPRPPGASARVESLWLLTLGVPGLLLAAVLLAAVGLVLLAVLVAPLATASRLRTSPTARRLVLVAAVVALIALRP
jgi:hypothetical protein